MRYWQPRVLIIAFCTWLVLFHVFFFWTITPFGPDPVYTVEGKSPGPMETWICPAKSGVYRCSQDIAVEKFFDQTPIRLIFTFIGPFLLTDESWINMWVSPYALIANPYLSVGALYIIFVVAEHYFSKVMKKNI